MQRSSTREGSDRAIAARAGRFASALLPAVAAIVLVGCSVRQMAIDTLGDTLASGGSVYEADADVALVGDALPFSLKLLDSLIAESPRHRGLLTAGSRAYLLYAYGFVGFEAERVARDDVDRGNVVRARAHHLSMRAHGYAVRALEVRHPGLAARLGADADAALLAVSDAAGRRAAARRRGIAGARDRPCEGRRRDAGAPGRGGRAARACARARRSLE